MTNITSPTSSTSENWAQEYGAEVQPWEIALVVAGYTDENIARFRPPNATPVSDAAMAYAMLLGWKVFPAPPGEKKSHVAKAMRFGSGENWGMTSDLALIRKYWKRWPRANVGVPTGWVNRIIVIETDNPKGHENLEVDGEESLKAVEARLGPLPDTLMAVSPSGSRHRYFAHPGDKLHIRNSASEIGPGVDVRGDGGMLVAPPSVRKDGVYKWLNDLPIAPLPERWIKELTEVRPAAVATLPEDANWAQSYGVDDEDEPPTLEELREILDNLPNDDVDWEYWNDVAMRLWAAAVALNAYDQVYQLFEDWSRKSEKKFNRGLTRKKWRLLRGNPPTRYGVRAIFNLAYYGTENGSDTARKQAEIERLVAEEMAKPRLLLGGESPEHIRSRITAEVNGAHVENLREMQLDREAAARIEPVDLWAQSRVPPLPKGLLPKVIEDFAVQQGELMGADPAGLAMAALTVCAAAIPDRFKLQPKKSDRYWLISTRMWTALVGDVSAMKSPVIDQCMRPIHRIDAELRREFAKAMQEYEALPNDEKKDAEEPVLKRIMAGDVTLESAQDIFKDNDEGILIYRDELSGLFGATDKYNGHKGAHADRAFWLAAHKGGSYPLDRVKRGSYLIPNLSISVLGGIQPDTARRLFADGIDDGLMQRLIPIMQRNKVLGSEEAPVSPPAEPYEALVERLFNLRTMHGLDLVCFDDGAGAIRRQLEEKHLKLGNAYKIVNRKLAAHIGKYDGMFAGFCLLWHTIEHHDDTWSSNINADTARRVASFLHDFLFPHALAFYRNTFGLSDDHERLTAVAGYVLVQKLERLTNRDIQRGVRTMRNCDRRDIESVFEQLSSFAWVIRKPGRRFDAPTWDVNPAVHVKFAEQRDLEVEQRQELQRLMVETFTKHEESETKIAQHPSGYILWAHPGKLTPPWVQLKLVRPGPVKKRLGESSRVWLKWNIDKRELDERSITKLAAEPAEIQDWLADVLDGMASA